MNFFVCFLPNSGKIEKISNEKDDNFSNLEIDRDSYVKFMQGELDFNEYTVVFDPKSKAKYELVKKEKSSSYNYINKNIRPFKKTKKIEKETDVFYIIQKNKDKKWTAKATLSEEYIRFLSNTSNFFDQTKRFYVTIEGNPNAFLGSFDIDMKNFLKTKEFTITSIDAKIQESGVSLFTNIINETYIHVVKD